MHVVFFFKFTPGKLVMSRFWIDGDLKFRISYLYLPACGM